MLNLASRASRSSGRHGGPTDGLTEAILKQRINDGARKAKCRGLLGSQNFDADRVLGARARHVDGCGDAAKDPRQVPVASFQEIGCHRRAMTARKRHHPGGERRRSRRGRQGFGARRHEWRRLHPRARRAGGAVAIPRGVLGLGAPRLRPVGGPSQWLGPFRRHADKGGEVAGGCGIVPPQKLGRTRVGRTRVGVTATRCAIFAMAAWARGVEMLCVSSGARDDSP